MIARLAGTLAEKAPDRVVVDVQGVGYAVFVSLQTFTALPAAGATVRLLVHTEVREDAIDLFGFADEAERSLFQLLRKVKGLGPRTSLAVLSGMPAAQLAAVIAAGDVARLQTIPGVGKKLAERMVVECRGAAALLAGGHGPHHRRDRRRRRARRRGGVGARQPGLQAARGGTRGDAGTKGRAGRSSS